jgi:hypothetical protein
MLTSDSFKFCFLYKNWLKFVTPTTSPNYEQRVHQGMTAQKTLEQVVMRRDFGSGLPAGSQNTIGRSMPKKHVYSVERIFAPDDQRIYTNQLARWRNRIFTTHTSAALGTNVPAANARTSRALQIINFLPLTGYLHYEVLYEKRPAEHPLGDDDDSLDEKYNRDRELWFYNKSPLFKAYEALPKMKLGERGERLRWILKTARTMGCEALGPELDIDGMSNATLAQLIVQHSPKMQAILGLYNDWCLLANEKLIFWFNTPIIQELAQTVMELLGISIFSVYSGNNNVERARVADQWNDPKVTTRGMFASAAVFGTGHNLQNDCRAACMVDTPDTDNREQQVWGRTYRGGQLLDCHFFRLIVRGSYAETLLS